MREEMLSQLAAGDAAMLELVPLSGAQTQHTPDTTWYSTADVARLTLRLKPSFEISSASGGL
jgi:hypothetical protein